MKIKSNPSLGKEYVDEVKRAVESIPSDKREIRVDISCGLFRLEAKLDKCKTFIYHYYFDSECAVSCVVIFKEELPKNYKEIIDGMNVYDFESSIFDTHDCLKIWTREY